MEEERGLHRLVGVVQMAPRVQEVPLHIDVTAEGQLRPEMKTHPLIQALLKQTTSRDSGKGGGIPAQVVDQREQAVTGGKGVEETPSKWGGEKSRDGGATRGADLLGESPALKGNCPNSSLCNRLLIAFNTI